ncbi:neurofilament heavy polypeptide-like isoform X1 [Populus alba x Populus x berolinensis]|nr:neurofilament heavy polypeptide-like isoform X1 [Populus alba x Populus x berolinensis]
MGACATKPEVLKEGETPEPAKEEVVVATGGDVQVEDKAVAVDEEEKKVVFEKDIGDAGGDKVEETEIVDDNKRRSLSNLFKENEKGKEPKESDKAPAEQEKPETSETKKPTEPEVPKEEPSTVKEEPVVLIEPKDVNAPVKVETEKVTSEVKPETSETKKPTEPEVPEEESSTVKEEPVVVIEPKDVNAPVKVETEKVTSEVTPAAAEPKTTETLGEKKPVGTETKTTETVGEKKPEETP